MIREVLSKVRVTVKKWGNSAAVRLPTSVMKATQLEVDEVVEVEIAMRSVDSIFQATLVMTIYPFRE